MERSSEVGASHSLRVSLDLNVDDKPFVWMLYQPEEDQFKDPNMYLWVRRCTLYASFSGMVNYFNEMGVIIASCRPRGVDFPDLGEFIDVRGRKWYFCKGTVNA